MAAVRWCVCAIMITACCAAFGRDEQGRLDQVLLPHEGRPAVASPGDVLRITARTMGTVALESAGTRIELAAAWRGIEGGLAMAEAVLPKVLMPGRYDVVWQKGDLRDRNVSAVRIVGAPVESYVLRVVREPALHDSDVLESIFSEIDDGVDGVLIWGGLGSLAEEDQVRLLERIRAVKHDVFVVSDDTPLNRALWGGAPARLPIGRDSVLVFSFASPTGLRGPIAEERIYRLRRESVADRWSVGLCSDEPRRDGIRNGLTVLADEPLAYLALPLADAEPRTPRAFPAPRIGSLPAPLVAGEFVDWVFEVNGVSARVLPDAP